MSDLTEVEMISLPPSYAVNCYHGTFSHLWTRNFYHLLGVL